MSVADDHNGQPSPAIPLERQLLDYRTVAQWLTDAQTEAQLAADLLGRVLESASRDDLLAAQRWLGHATNGVREVIAAA